MEEKIGIRRGELGRKEYSMTDCLEKKPQGIWWVERVVGILPFLLKSFCFCFILAMTSSISCWSLT